MTQYYHLEDLRELSGAGPHRSLKHRLLTELANELGEDKVKKVLARAYNHCRDEYASLEWWMDALSKDAKLEEVQKVIKGLCVDHRAAGRNVSIFHCIMGRLKDKEQPAPGDPFYAIGRYVFIYYLAGLGQEIGAMYLWDMGYRAISTAPEEMDYEKDPFAGRLYSDW